MIEIFKLLNIQCFILVKVFLFVEEHELKKNDETYHVMNDFEHRLCQFSLRDFVMNFYYKMN